MKTLLCTLGTSAPVVTETLDALRIKKNITIDRLVIIHTTFKDVFNKRTKSGKEVGLNAMVQYLRSHRQYTSLQVVPKSLERESILTEEDNNHLLRVLLQAIAEEHRAGNEVYLSIAGGFKTMSAMALFAAYLLGCHGVYHILIQGDEFSLTDQYGFEIPVAQLALVEIPTISLAPFLRTVVAEIDREGKFGGDLQKYLGAGRDLREVFDRTNDELVRIATERALKDKYEQMRDVYEQLCIVVATILRARAKELLVMKPQIDFRVKSFESTLEKAARKKLSAPFEGIRDFAGVRVICYFREDVAAMVGAIKSAPDFHKIEHQTHSGAQFRYQDEKFYVQLAPKRIELIESTRLQGVWCEIQVKTFFDHAWSQVEHRFRYKSDEYKKLSPQDQESVDKAFLGTNVNIEDALNKLSQLRKMYTSFVEQTSINKP